MSDARRIRRPALSDHRCPGACGRLIPVRQFVCDPCWDRLPRDIRRSVVRHTRGGQTGAGRDQVLAAAAAAAWFLANPPWDPLSGPPAA